MNSRNAFTILLAVAAILASTATYSPAQSVIKIDASKKGEPISPYIYGQFIEHLGRCIYGGIWAEMLEDRKFYYPVGSPQSPWKPFGNLNLVMDKTNPFCGEHSPKIILDEQVPIGSIMQSGLALPHKDQPYTGYIWLKCEGKIDNVTVITPLKVALEGANMILAIGTSIPVKTGDFYRHDFVLLGAPNAEGQIRIEATGTGSVTIGCVSLMPADNVNGMRADTLKLLKELNSPVYRWPGGNFVSGYDWRDGIGDRDKRPPRKNPA
ncbi:MAG: hypothetical protein LBI05_09765, partial [Planctomycetaceae bacterium]|nr:hypothetical protein [Planctomycetaceae bacterium]